MGYEKLINIENKPPDNDKLEQIAVDRSKSIQCLIDDFLVFYEEKYSVVLEPIEDAALLLSYSYFKIVYSKIKPLVEERINCYKMGSIMELLIVKEQFLKHPDSKNNPSIDREVNALFGMTASFSMINCMISKADKEFYFDTLNHCLDVEVEKILSDHRQWLETKKLDEMPIIINAQFFHLLDILKNAPLQVNGF